MREIHITDDLVIYNDIPGFLSKYQPKWHKKVYYMWRDRWRRCKDPNSKDYEYYKDCEIDEDFKYLSKFVEWIVSDPRFGEFCDTCDKVMWSIDKDMKELHNKNYYPQYMTLTTQSENNKEMLNRCGNPTPKIPVIALSDNKILLFKSMSDARDKGFHKSNVSSCLNKKLKTYKDYKWFKVTYKHELRLRRVH